MTVAICDCKLGWPGQAPASTTFNGLEFSQNGHLPCSNGWLPRLGKPSRPADRECIRGTTHKNPEAPNGIQKPHRCLGDDQVQNRFGLLVEKDCSAQMPFSLIPRPAFRDSPPARPATACTDTPRRVHSAGIRILDLPRGFDEPSFRADQTLESRLLARCQDRG